MSDYKHNVVSKKNKAKKKPQANGIFKNKRFILIVMAIIVSCIVLIGGSYALFVVNVKSDKNNIIHIARFQVDYKDGSVINLNTTYPMTYNEGIMQDGYTFTLTNKSTINVIYKIYFEDSTDEDYSLIKDYIMLSYKKGTDPYTIPVKLSSLTDNILLKDQVLSNTDGSNSINYTIKLWLDDSAPNTIQGKNYKTKIKVYSSQEIKNNS